MCEQNDEASPLVVSFSIVLCTSPSVPLVPPVRHISAVGFFLILHQTHDA
jgi:hypothetical protein